MCDYRESRENWEWANLAPYASHSSDPSLAWRRSENDADVANPLPPRNRPVGIHFPDADRGATHTPDLAGSLSRFKTAFQVDKERIAGCTAFRRLEYKTQMFVSHEGDHFRTRLTHTIEVDETARFIARALRLNEDLVEAIALGHDLGHTPFGHGGEATLHRMFHKYWPADEANERVNGEQYGPAFYHNVQSVRVVDSLEKGYEWDRRPVRDQNDLHNPAAARGRGMDLTWAVREGILKHSSRGLRPGEIRMYGAEYLMAELDPFQPATLEGQIVEFADEIASVMHDLEDGLRSRLFTLTELREVLLEWIRPDNLPDLLGLTQRFGHEEDPLERPRVRKWLDLLKEIRKDDDYTVGMVLAFLRSVLVSNLVETSYWRLLSAMEGDRRSSPHNTPAAASRADHDELIWIHMTIDTDPSLDRKSYCPEAWDSNPARREATLQTFRRDGYQARPTSAPVAAAARVSWVIKSSDPYQSRDIVVERENNQSRIYPLGNVCLSFSGAKLVGYDRNILELRHWLRHKFIPDRLHNASAVLRMNDKGQRFLGDLFERYVANPCLMHRTALERYDMWDMATSSPEHLRKRKSFVLRIVEHLQGMTDRYLTEEYSRLFLPGANVGERDEMCIVDGAKPPFGRLSRAPSPMPVDGGRKRI